MSVSSGPLALYVLLSAYHAAGRYADQCLSLAFGCSLFPILLGEMSVSSGPLAFDFLAARYIARSDADHVQSSNHLLLSARHIAERYAYQCQSGPQLGFSLLPMVAGRDADQSGPLANGFSLLVILPADVLSARRASRPDTRTGLTERPPACTVHCTGAHYLLCNILVLL